MRIRDLWLTGAAVGIATVLATALMFVTAVAVAALVVPLARRPGGRAAVFGELTAFGAVWVALVARESASGGALDNGAFWTAVGVVPLTIGIALSIRLFITTLRASRATT